MKIKNIIISILFLILIPFNVYAKNDIIFKANKTVLDIGEEIVLTAKFPETTDLYALMATLSYDENVFEAITTPNFSLSTDALSISYNDETNKFGIINKTGTLSNEIFTVRLKVKEDANVGTTNIALINISSSDGETKVTYPKKTIEVLVTKDAAPNETVPDNKPNAIVETPEEIRTTYTITPALIGVGLVGLLTLFCIIFICLFRKKEKKIRNIYIVLFIFFLGAFIYLLNASYTKKDINHDGEKNYEDSQEIMEYLLDIKKDKNKEEQEENNPSDNNTSTSSKPSSNSSTKKPNHKPQEDFDFDVNNDGNLDINDVADSVKHTTTKTHYTVKLTEVPSEINYVAKNNIVLTFSATVTPNETIKEVMVNGKFYPVINNDTSYEVKVDCPSMVGDFEFKITQVKLSNNRLIDTDLTIKKAILKDIPYVTKFNFDDKENKIAFDLIDLDEALIEGNVLIIDDEGKTLLNEKISSTNSFNIEGIADNKIYTVYVYATYDLSSSSNPENLYKDKEIYKHSFTKATNYDFTLTNLTITDAIEKDEKPKITFESTNNLGFNIEYVIINQKQYNISLKDQNHYEVLLDSLDTSLFGQYDLNVDAVLLDNLKLFSNPEDFQVETLTYNVLKNAPTIENIELTPNSKTEDIEVSYTFNDRDNTLLKLKAILTDSTGKIIDTKDNLNPKEPLKLSYKDSNDGRYNVKFLADCNLGTERHIYKDKLLNEESVLTQAEVYILKALPKSVYPQKNEAQYTIKYQAFVSDAIKDKYNELAGVTINGLNYDGMKDSDFQSLISFTVPNKSGILNLKVDRVKLRKETYQGVTQEYFSVAPFIIQIDVLKDVPTIENFQVTEEDYNNSTATFEFDVNADQGGFESGEIDLNIESKTITPGHNKITFENINLDTPLDLDFYGTYDLDSNVLPEEINQNKYTLNLIHTIKYGLYKPETYAQIKLINPTVNKKYYAQNENITLNFDIVGLTNDLTISKVIFRNDAYPVLDNSINIKGFSISGLKEIYIDKVILSNGKTITLQEPVKVNIEVLKNAPRLTNVDYNITNDNINIKYELKDPDRAIKDLSNDLKISVYDENNTLIQEIPYTNNIVIPINKDILRYYIKIMATYDLDTSWENDNYFNNNILLDKMISLAQNRIDITNITDISLYQNIDSKIVAIDTVNVDELKANISSYFVSISLKDMPTIHAKLKSAYIENSKLILVLDYQNVVKNSTKTEDLKIEFGPVVDGVATNENHAQTITSLIEQIKSDPSATITLKNDIDAKIDVATNTLIDVEFSGILDGNGHSIINLSKPLFNNINGGVVKNLKLENVNLSSNLAQGTLANTASGATINSVLINNLTKTSSPFDSGSLIGLVTNNSKIENCRVSNFKINVIYNNQRVGGLVGSIKNSQITNSYVNGTISANWNYIGAIAGDASNTTISYSYAKVNMSGYLSCGFACTISNNLVLTNNFSASSGASNSFANNYKTAQNNYLVNSKKESTSSVIDIFKDEVNTALFQENLKFDSNIWLLNNISYDNLPIFNIEKASKLNLDGIEDLYDETKETLYSNLMLLMPFYDNQKIITSAINIPSDNILAKEPIKHLIPVNKEGNVVTYLTSTNPDEIVKLKVIFKNGEKATYDVIYDNNQNMIASYRIPSFQIDYTYNHYIINASSQLINNLTNYLTNLTYEDNLDILTAPADSRIYRDYYYDVTKKELKEFVLKYLSNSNYTNTTNDKNIDNYLEKTIKENNKLEKLLYTYNYFKRFYDVSIDGIKLNDLILFNFQGFDPNLTPETIADKFLANTNNINTNETNNTYNRLFSTSTNLDNITDLLAYLVRGLSNETPDSWYAKSFKGYLKEIKVDGRDDILYTLWSHISNPDTGTNVNWYNYCLPILTLPENAAYIISTPTQFIIGAQRTYITDPFDANAAKDLQARIASYATRMKDYYTTASKILEQSKYFNDIHTIQIDKRYTYTENGVLMFQNPYSTEEPFHKNFNEVIGQWAYNDYNAATANGAYIIWRVEGLMDGRLEENSEYTYHTWSHETAHNIDARLFLKNNGRRFDAGGEDYADNNLMQAFNDNDIVMNFSRVFAPNSNIGSNLTPQRIDSLPKVYDFYNKLFQTIYILDYLEGKAFLSLTPLEQSKLVVQASYPNLNIAEYQTEEKEYLKYKYTVYQTISEDTIKQMSLTDIDSLYANQLVIFPKVIYSTYTDNKYGGEGINKVHWYQPHNDYGRPDSYSLKWFAYEMLGYKGYDDGYIKYYSNINSINVPFHNNYKTDLMALQDITNDPNMTFETYKHMRFAEVENRLEDIQIIDVNTTFTRFYEALKEDAKYVQQVEEQAWSQYPSDSDEDTKKRNNLISNAREYKNSTALRKEIFYTLKNGTNDFLDAVYDSSNKQEVGDLSIPKIEELEDIPSNDILIEEPDNSLTIPEEDISINSEEESLEEPTAEEKDEEEDQLEIPSEDLTSDIPTKKEEPQDTQVEIK